MVSADGRPLLRCFGGLAQPSVDATKSKRKEGGTHVSLWDKEEQSVKKACQPPPAKSVIPHTPFRDWDGSGPKVILRSFTAIPLPC